SRPFTPPVWLISSIASNVARNCVSSMTAITPDCENNAPTHQDSGLPGHRFTVSSFIEQVQDGVVSLASSLLRLWASASVGSKCCSWRHGKRPCCHRQE